MTLLDAAYWVCALVLVVSGATKLADGTATWRTLRELGVPAPRVSGRAIGALEVLVGGAGLMAPAGVVAVVAALLVALMYLGFAAVVLAAMRAGLDDCGCIGVRQRRPSTAHLVADLVAAAVAAGASLVGPTDLVTGLATSSVLWAVVVGIAVAVSAGALVALPGD